MRDTIGGRPYEIKKAGTQIRHQLLSSGKECKKP